MQPVEPTTPHERTSVIAYTDESLRAVAYRMARTRQTRITVDRENPSVVAGVVSLSDLLSGRRRTLEAEQRRERVLSLPFALPRRKEGMPTL
jgi:hypothetical protein